MVSGKLCVRVLHCIAAVQLFCARRWEECNAMPFWCKSLQQNRRMVLSHYNIYIHALQYIALAWVKLRAIRGIGIGRFATLPPLWTQVEHWDISLAFYSSTVLMLSSSIFLSCSTEHGIEFQSLEMRLIRTFMMISSSPVASSWGFSGSWRNTRGWWGPKAPLNVRNFCTALIVSQLYTTLMMDQQSCIDDGPTMHCITEIV